MVKIPVLPLLLAIGLAMGGCSVSSIEQLPASVGGLPSEAPARPQTPYEFPAVHDLPPPRSTQPMSDDELLKAENALEAARERQEKLEKAGEDGDGEAEPVKQ